MSRRWALVTNPAAGGSSKARTLEKIAAELADVELRIETPAGREATISRCRELAAEVDVILAYGGDGTAAAVAAGIVGADVALGVLPGGTANVLARDLGLSMSPVRAARALLSAHPRRVDVGRANGTVFLLMASVGVDAKIMRDLSGPLKRRFGRAGIGLSALGTILAPPRFALQVTTDDREFECGLVVVSNWRYYGGSFAIAPEADPADGLFDLVAFPPCGPLGMGRYAAALAVGRHTRLPDVTMCRSSRVRVEAERSAPAQIDGDAHGETPLEIEIEPGALLVLAP